MKQPIIQDKIHAPLLKNTHLGAFSKKSSDAFFEGRIFSDFAKNVVYQEAEDAFKNKLDDETIKAGVSFADIRDESQELNTFSNNRNGGIATYKEPTEKAKLRYRNNRTFKVFADEVYEFINECDTLRSEAVLYHLNEIRKSAGKRGVNTQSSQWFLERAVPEHFGKKDTITQRIEGNMHQTFSSDGDVDKPALPPIKVEFINPNSNDSLNRLKEMENKVKDQVLGKDAA